MTCAACQLPAVSGPLCEPCARDAATATLFATRIVRHTEDICVTCGDLLTVDDAQSSSPNQCPICRSAAFRNAVLTHSQAHL